MVLPRFYVPADRISKEAITLAEKDSHHIFNVLRLRRGDGIIIFDGSGLEYLCKISGSSNMSAVITLEKKLKVRKSVSRGCSIVLAQALPKKAKMDYIVEKACELGVARIIPMTSERTIVKLDCDKAAKRVERWRRIAQEAAKQSRGSSIAQISDVESIEQVLLNSRDYGLAIMFCLGNKAKELKAVLRNRNPQNILVMIGPEGDFSDDEVTNAAEAGCKLASLGEAVLKVDTAAISAVSILNYEFNLKLKTQDL